jgi:hypothetical protein
MRSECNVHRRATARLHDTADIAQANQTPTHVPPSPQISTGTGGGIIPAEDGHDSRRTGAWLSRRAISPLRLRRSARAMHDSADTWTGPSPRSHPFEAELRRGQRHRTGEEIVCRKVSCTDA